MSLHTAQVIAIVAAVAAATITVGWCAIDRQHRGRPGWPEVRKTCGACQRPILWWHRRAGIQVVSTTQPMMDIPLHRGCLATWMASVPDVTWRPVGRHR
jgi:hypothetical protein